MTDFTQPIAEVFDRLETAAETEQPRQVGMPSNEVYARVGDTVLRAAREGVRGGMRPDDIIREIVTEHHVRMNLSELRLLLASRRIPGHDTPAERAVRDAPLGDSTMVGL